MSHPLVSHSPDLQRLYEDGYTLEIRSNLLLIKDVPFVTKKKTVAYGILVSELTTTGTQTAAPSTHVALFVGGIPCNAEGLELQDMIHSPMPSTLADGLVAACSFSRKPASGYPDYHAKMTGYLNMIVGWAQAVDPTATAKRFPPVRPSEEESIFRYLDSASSRAQITHLSEKLKLPKIAIAGLGGTGSYILDFLAKTPVREIHIYDSDVMYAHNAFRAPGAASADELDERPFKVSYLQRKYDAMHRGVIAHPVDIDETNVAELATMSFVFISMDTGEGKRLIVEALEQAGVPFIDVGMGAEEIEGGLNATIRTTAIVPGQHHEQARARISFAEPADDAYDRNIQIAELNAFNAIMAIIKWKKLCGFYADSEREHTSAYVLRRNLLINEDQSE